MAGDWIKMRSDLRMDPAVVSVSLTLGIPEAYVVGCLHQLWSWADAQTRDGYAPRVSAAWVDRFVGVDGFAQALADVDWLEILDDGVRVPNFDRHNGEPAKKRAQAKKRKQKERANLDADPDPGHGPVTDLSRTERDESVTREEKRREEKNPPPARARSSLR